MAPDSGEYLDRKLKPIWDELGKLRDRLEAHHESDSDEHKKIVVLQIEVKIMDEKLKELTDIERGRTLKLIAVVGCVTGVILAASEILKFIFHR